MLHKLCVAPALTIHKMSARSITGTKEETNSLKFQFLKGDYTPLSDSANQQASLEPPSKKKKPAGKKKKPGAYTMAF